MGWLGDLIFPYPRVFESIAEIVGGKPADIRPSETPDSGLTPQLQNMILGQPPAAPPPAGTLPGLATDEETSGRAADAIAKLHTAMEKHRDNMSDIGEQLSTVLLQAHMTTQDGLAKLDQIQTRIEAAINNPNLQLDTPAGETAFLQFLKSQVVDIKKLVDTGAVADADTARKLTELSGLIPDAPTAASPGADTGSDPKPASDTTAAASTPAVSDTSGSASDPAADPGLADPGYEDPSYGDPYTDPYAPATDPMQGLAQQLPQMMSPLSSGLGSLGGIPSGMMSPLSSMGGLGSMMQPAAQPVADSKPVHDHSSDPQYVDDSAYTTDPATTDTTTASDTPADTPTPAAPGSDTPATTPAPPSSSVTLPDGSQVSAPTPAVAKAVTSYLGGTPIDQAYKDAGITLPPPGPITNGAIDVSQVGTGDLAVFQDRYVPALSSAKAWSEGQIVPLQSVASGAGFLGWLHPEALAAPASTPVPTPAPTTPTPPR